jgi:uncharacterized membrane protein HdeD (DUF308 family)
VWNIESTPGKETETTMSALQNAAPRPTEGWPQGLSLGHVYIGRALLAGLWAGVFAVVGSSYSTGAKVLLVAYPLIDVGASLLDSRAQKRPEAGSLQRLLVLNAAVSAAATVALALAAGHTVAAALHVFGAWAAVSGLLQLAVVIRRRPRFGRQPAMLVSGTLSTAAGISFIILAASHDPKLTSLAGYAGFGATLFILSAIRSPS